MRKVNKPTAGEQHVFEGEEVGHIFAMAALLMATSGAAKAPSAAIALAAQYYVAFRGLLEQSGAGVSDVVDGRRFRIIYKEGRRPLTDGASLVVDVSPAPPGSGDAER